MNIERHFNSTYDKKVNGLINYIETLIPEDVATIIEPFGGLYNLLYVEKRIGEHLEGKRRKRNIPVFLINDDDPDHLPFVKNLILHEKEMKTIFNRLASKNSVFNEENYHLEYFKGHLNPKNSDGVLTAIRKIALITKNVLEPKLEDYKIDYELRHSFKDTLAMIMPRLRLVTIFSENYLAFLDRIINKIKNGFIYFDLPYSIAELQTITNPYMTNFKHADFIDKLKKGIDSKFKFIISVEDTPEIADLYEGYFMKRIEINRQEDNSERIIPELLISNYDLDKVNKKERLSKFF